MASSAPKPRRSLSARLLWLTIGVVVAVEMLFFVPALTLTRWEWFDRRITEAQIAALSASAAPDGVDRATRDNLLRLSGTVAIGVRRNGQDYMVLDSAVPSTPTERLDLVDETMPQAVFRAFESLFDAQDDLLQVEARSPLQGASELTLRLQDGELTRHLRVFARVFGLLSLGFAVLAALLVYFSLLAFLVRPMRHIIASIYAFRADPERTPPLDVAETMPLRDDEMAVAARELTAMQRELRTALWRNARLAAIGTAVAKVSHDLRGILSPALLAAERLQMSEDPGVHRAGDILVRTVDRATELVRSTLSFAREGPVVPERTRSSLREIVTEAVEPVRTTWPALRVEIACAEDLEIDADRGQLLRVFGNLLRNAAEAQATVVRIESSATPSEIAIDVADDAHGLPELVQQSLFRPFVAGGRRGGHRTRPGDRARPRARPRR